MMQILKRLLGISGETTGQSWETGLRIIDLLTPICPGSDVLFTGDEKSGAMLLGLEVAVRLHAPNNRVFVYFDSKLDELEERCKEFREFLPSAKGMAIDGIAESEMTQDLKSVAEPIDVTLCVLSRRSRLLDDFHQCVKNCRSSVGQHRHLRITSLAMTYEYRPTGFDTVVSCSSQVARSAIYPALHPKHCTSTSDALADAKTRNVSSASAAAINRVIDNLYDGAMSDENWQFGKDLNNIPALQAYNFMSQPFVTAEPYTGLIGAKVPFKQTVQEFQSILAGHFAHIAPRGFLYKNTLPQ